MREIVSKYIASCSNCQRSSYRNISPAIKLISVKVTLTLASMELDLLRPNAISNPARYRYVFVIVDYFSKCEEIVP